MSHTYARNTHDLVPKMVRLFNAAGYKRESRNGNVARLPGVTTVTLSRPYECVCFIDSRDANPFFHLMEALAMLVPVNSVEVLSFFASNMASFSDNGSDFNAFYGTRARVRWGDQINDVIRILKDDPNSRQAVVNLWDPMDLNKSTKDKACNLLMIFSVEDGYLHMTTFNRSNDAVWGFMTGANMVHFPFFHAYVANSLGVKIGEWHHASANMHVYDWNEKWKAICDEVKAELPPCLYGDGTVRPLELMSSPGEKRLFDIELSTFLFEVQTHIAAFNTGVDRGDIAMKGRMTPIIRSVAVPAFNAFLAYKRAKARKQPFTQDDYHAAAAHLNLMPLNNDWRCAMARWMNRRIK